MYTFRVWAPLPQKVELNVQGERLPMQRSASKWWTATVNSAGPGSDYGFYIDDEGPFPDPRSPWQPAGVHALSRIVDHSTFKWTDSGWQAPPLSKAIVYELHIGTFTERGTFDSAITKLDHLVDLGVSHVELMPVHEFPGKRGWGYDGVALFAPRHAYGGPDGLKRYVDACHAHGLAVILDVVYNHLGPSGNYLAKYAPYFTRRYQTPWGEAVNFDGPDSDEVRRFSCDNALMWFRDYHFDGLRLDAVHAIKDASAFPFLEQLGREVKELESSLGRALVVVPESDLNDPRLLWEHEHGGFNLDAQWSDDFHHALHTVLTGEETGYYADFGALADLTKAIRNAYVYDGRYSKFRRRSHGRPPTGLSGHRFLAYLQNHDQIGNRARGERMSQLVGVGRLKIGAALVLTSPFVPMLFQGEEWGASSPFLYFTDHPEPELATAVRDGRRREFAAFGWKPEEIPDPQAPESFERSKLNWSELTSEPHAEMLDWCRRLIRLRRAEPSLTDGRLDNVGTRFDEVERWLVVERGPISVACNLADRPKRIPLRPGTHQILMASTAAIVVTGQYATLPPDSVAILKLNESS
jgi:maltooligosyltrehalose trehalohydrolase